MSSVWRVGAGRGKELGGMEGGPLYECGWERETDWLGKSTDENNGSTSVHLLLHEIRKALNHLY